MSNFLQRIAASAAHGQSPEKPRLQPMLGSIFAPAMPLAMESGAASAPEVYPESMTSQPAAAANDPRPELLVPSAHESEFHFANSVPTQRFAPRAEGPILPSELSAHVLALSETERTRREQERTARREPEGATQADHAHRSGTVKSDSDETRAARHIQKLGEPPAIQVQSLRTAAPPRIDPVRRASAPRSEPDEIHIHIGKIEVAAIAPPPPRAAAPAPRKGINLDEYLRRGSGGRR